MNLNFFKKDFFFLFLVYAIIGCSSSEYRWQSSQLAINNSYKLKTGDIIVKDKLLTDPLSWLGHSSVMISDNRIGDFPMPGKDYYTISVNAWLNEPSRKVIVLRYKHFDKAFEKQFLKNIQTYGYGKYRTSFFKKKDSDFYCSKFVWFLFYKTAQDLGYNLDLDSNQGILIFPYDFLNSSDLTQIIL
ncbi:MAG: YiiX/YebB-like N1pC/P60 family cysteine hydrolase [Cetobacterium sp.]|uniref:YiiX/YebB-like N1pC/P60 family cysteine hydrolase n=1 Tax=Cetobacterium sp. TaxID=2071632 RepID=UPI003F362A73